MNSKEGIGGKLRGNLEFGSAQPSLFLNFFNLDLLKILKCAVKVWLEINFAGIVSRGRVTEFADMGGVTHISNNTSVPLLSIRLAAPDDPVLYNCPTSWSVAGRANGCCISTPNDLPCLARCWNSHASDQNLWQSSLKFDK